MWNGAVGRTAPLSSGVANDSPDVTLQTMLGPYGGWFPLPAGNAATIGRAAECDICLLHETVGRQHASLMRQGHSWFVADLGTAAGTYLNGVRLEAQTATPIASADLLRIGPWTFRVVLGTPAAGVIPEMEEATTKHVRIGGVSSLGIHRLRVLSQCLSKLGGASGEEEMARLAIEAALEGSGYRRGAMLRPIESIDPGRHEVSVVASVRMGPMSERERRFGKAILEAAWNSAGSGRAAVLTPELEPVQAPSNENEVVVPGSIVCAPVLLGQTLVSFLYLDGRGFEGQIQADAADFVEAVAGAYGLALANLRRQELDRRQQALAAELHAAREAQQFILPPPRGEHGFVRYAMHMKPGLFVAGDLFETVLLPDGRVGAFLGDVAGHGAASAMLMATTQAYLNAELRDGQSPASAVDAVNQYLSGRSLGGRFVSLWLGMFSPDGTVEYVDAGHGHWMHVSRKLGIVATAPDPEGDIPLGIDASRRYSSRTISLAKGDRIVAFSDGIVEQRRPGGSEFGIERLRNAVSASTSADDDVAMIFAAVLAFAGTSTLADDATAASVEYL